MKESGYPIWDIASRPGEFEEAEELVEVKSSARTILKRSRLAELFCLFGRLH